jgi:SAM-dependent methyltransferase
MPSMTDVHPIATGGYSRSADSYVRGRPTIRRPRSTGCETTSGLGPGKAVLELGAGTGKFTRLLMETGAVVTAVEPVGAMLDELRRSLPAVSALHGTAQRIPAADAGADAVLCAQAFHWFASAESLAEDPPRLETRRHARTHLERSRSVRRLGGRADPHHGAL